MKSERFAERLGVKGPGACFGSTALLFNCPRTATVVRGTPRAGALVCGFYSTGSPVLSTGVASHVVRTPQEARPRAFWECSGCFGSVKGIAVP